MRALIPVALLLALGGCATASHVTLLPGEAGMPVGAVAVLDPKSETDLGVIDKENMGSTLGGKLQVRPVKAGKYAALTSVMPPPAHHFTLYFLEGSTTLAPGSEAVLNQMFAELTLRSGAEVQIIGHTDTVGSEADNDRLSLKRATDIRDALVTNNHLSPAITAISGRGERELLVRTADGVNEARNRRVEIVVR